MIKFDFKTYTKNFIDKDKYDELYNRKSEVFESFNNSDMIGWTKRIDSKQIDDIKTTAKYIKTNFDCLVVIGIGGSFLGSYSFDKMFRKYFNDKKYEIIYAGTSLSSKYIDELLAYLKNKNFCINVISKSGTTMETSITYKLLKEFLKRKYSEEELSKHIIVTTDKEKGTLREEANEKKYKSFIIPNDIGGRYSFITPAHLLPLAINYNIDEIIGGYYNGKKLIDIAFEYAVTRNALYKSNRFIENFCVSEENMSFFTEWIKQLFGETEGKNNKGIFPASTVYTKDLHSLGQFMQDGTNIIFETFITIANTDNYVDYNGRELHSFNNIVIDSVKRAHYKGGVPCIEIELTELELESVSSLIYFFMLSAAFSAFLMGVNPFDQPGVEVYKQEVKKAIEK